jgi:hypothetical protein
MSKKIKPFKSLVRIDIGGISHRELFEQAVKNGDIAWTDWAEEIFAKTEHLPRRFSVEIVPIIIRIDLPNMKGLKLITDKDKKEKEEVRLKKLLPVYTEALENGLCLSPASVALEILLQTSKEFVGEAFLAMKAVSCKTSAAGHGQENILSISDGVCAIPGKRWLNGTPGNLNDFADGGYTLLFCRRCPTLVRAGLASI